MFGCRLIPLICLATTCMDEIENAKEMPRKNWNGMDGWMDAVIVRNYAVIFSVI